MAPNLLPLLTVPSLCPGWTTALACFADLDALVGVRVGLKSLGAFGQLRDRLGSIQHVPSTVKGCEDSDEEAISDLVEDSDKCTVDKFSHGGGGPVPRGAKRHGR